MASILFGSGYAFLRDSAGNAHQVGILQDITVDFEATSKELRGSQQYPLAVAISGRGVSGKAKHAEINGKVMGSLLSATVAAGRKLYKTNVSYAAAASVTPSPTGTGFVADMGVLDRNGNPMTITSSAPGVGSYSVSGPGAYTFNASETGSLQLSWAYTTGTGYTAVLNNQDQGMAPTYELHLQEQFQGESFGVKLYAVAIPKIGLAFKNEDFGSDDIEFKAQANSAGQIGELYFE